MAIKNKYYLFILFILIFSFSCNNNNQEIPKAKKGIIDLSKINFDNSQSINLKGEWELYHNKLLNPDDFTGVSPLKDVEYVKIPTFKIPTDKNSSSNYSFSTFRILIKTNTDIKQLAIQTGMYYTSSKIWINGREVKEIGKVSETKKNFKSGVNIDIVSFDSNPNSDYIEIIIQTSNFIANNNGIRDTYIGSYKKIKTNYRNNILIAGILIGLILIISFYHFILYFIQLKKYSTLSFAIFSLIIGIRTIVENNIFLPEMSYTIFSKISYITAALYPALIVVFFYFLFPKEFHKKIVLIFVVISSLFTLLILFAKPIIYTQTDTYIALLILFSLIYSIIFLIKSIKNKNNGAWLALAGSIILFSTNINDILYNLHFVQSVYLTHFGVAIYIIFQSLNIAQRYSLSFKENLILTTRLDFQNLNLEQIVEKRTGEIREKNEELQQQGEELKQQKEELKQTANYLDKVNKETKEKNILIASSINYAKTIQQAILPSKIELKKHFDLFIIYRPRDVVSGDFYWYSVVKPYKVSKDLTRFNASKDLTRFNASKDLIRLIAVVDCTGHGVPGAFMSMISNQILNQIVNEQHIYEPKKILNLLNINIIKSLRQDDTKNLDGLDLILCRIDKPSNVSKNIMRYNMTYAAARTSLFVYNSQEQKIIKYKGHYSHIGGWSNINKEIVFTENIINIQTNDMLYLTSDGIIDQNNSERKRLGTKKLMNLFNKVANNPLSEQKQTIENELNNFQENEPQRDDITVLGIKI